MPDNTHRSIGSFKSPVRKLASFFKESRDQWKAKYKEKKFHLKRAKDVVRYLRERDRVLQAQLKELRAEIERIRKREFELMNIIEKLSANAKSKQSYYDLTVFEDKPRFHTFSTGHMYLYLLLVISSSTTLRGASRVMGIFSSFFGMQICLPSWYSGRLWLLRLGYFKLTREKEKADDWIWMLDHTIQWGKEKCLIIMGIRRSMLPDVDTILRHEDLEPIAMFPVELSNGKVVYSQLEKTIEHTGIPREIISDHGSDLKKGVNLFCSKHPETCYIYDIKHKTAAILKRELNNEDRWKEFVRLADKTRTKLQQTSLAVLAPPNQRAKSRYMNVDVMVNWGKSVLIFLDQDELGWNKQGFDPELITERLGWLTAFRNELAEWNDMMGLVQTAEEFVNHNGIYKDSAQDLLLVPGFEVQHTERTERVRTEILEFVKEQGVKAKPEERLLGSTQVLESVIGKVKNIEGTQSKSGFTGLLLSVAAIVSQTSEEIVKSAMEAVPTKEALEWVKTNIGKTLQSKRKAVSDLVKRAEQNCAENWCGSSG